MTTAAPAPDDVLEKVDALGPPGTPVTTPEVAEGFDCTKRTIYNRLDSLAEDGVLQTKKVGANSRVWWRPAQDRGDQREHSPNGGEPIRAEERPDWGPTVIGSGGEMSERIREFEWAETPLGPIAEWPRELRTAADIMLGAEEAIGIYWGDDLVLLYNDAWRELVGDKHPGALGEPARDVFPEIWETIGPMFTDVLDGEGAAIERERLLPLERNGRIEDAKFDYSANPIPMDDGSVGGIFNVAVEVTDRVRTEQDLRETGERLEVALNAAGMGAWKWDLDERTVRADETMLSLFDLPPTDGPVPVERFLEKESAAGAAQAEDTMDASFEPGEELQDEFRLENVESPRWISWRGRASTDDPSVLNGVSFEITERKQAEIERERALEALRESEEKYHSLFEEMNEGFALCELVRDGGGQVSDIRFAELNEAFEELIGVSRPEAEGRLAGEVLPGQENSFFATFERVAETGEPERIENYVPANDRWYEVHLFPREGDTVAVLYDDITERKTEELHREERYQALFESINEGFCIIEVLLDGDDEQEDYRFLATNPAFEEITGLTDVDGKRRRELEQDYDPRFFNRYGQVARTGESKRFEASGEPLIDGWYDIRAFPYGESGSNKVALLIDDITERKSAERQLERQAELDGFRVELTDTIRPLADPIEIQQEAARTLGEQLNVDRAHYGEVLDDGQTNRIYADYHSDDVSSLVGEHSLEDYGEYIAEGFRAGETVVVGDAGTLADLSAEERAMYESVDIAAWIGVPLHKDGELTAFFTVTESEPRTWTDAEVEMVEETADRTWEAVHRAQAEAEVRESEATLSGILEQLPLGVGVLNADGVYERQNDRMTEILGGNLLPSRDPEKRAEWYATDDAGDPLPPEEWPGARALRGEAVTPGIEFRLERDGETRWFNVAGVPFEGSEGEEEPKAIGVVQEITERKAVREAWRESREQLDAFVTATSEVVYRMSADWSEMYSLDGQEFITDTAEPRESWVEEYIPTDERERVMAAIEEAIETKSVFDLEHQVLTVDGTRGWVRSRALPIIEDGEIVEWFGTASDITERKEREEREQFLLTLSDRIRALESEEEIGATCTQLLAEEMGLDRAYFVRFLPDEEEALVGPEYHDPDLDPVSGLYPFSAVPEIQQIQTETPVSDDVATDSTLSEAERQALLELDFGAWIGAPIRTEAENPDWALYAVTSEPRNWTDAEVTLVEEAAERAWTAVERARAEQILSRSNQSLERLNDVSRELIDADPETISDRVAELTVDVLDVEYAALWRYDGRTGDLERSAEHAASGTDLDAIRPSEVSHEDVWETFVDDEIDVDNALDIAGGDSPSRLGSRVFVPLGRHGVVFAGAVDSETFDERLVDLVTMVASTVETVWDRAESEQELERQNEELTRLDQLNTLIREIDQTLVATDTREEIAAAVCERVADSDRYEFAWIGEHDPGTDVVEPRAWAGVDSGYLEELSITVENGPTDRDPIARAIRTGELQVVADIATDRSFAPWREATLERGARSLVCIPLVYDETVYGVLTVYADRPQSEADERNHEVLSELGDTIAHTINARETRATLQTDSVVELTLRVRDADTPLYRLAREAACSIDYQGFVPRSNGHADLFFVARGAPAERVRAIAADLLAFEDLQCLTERTDGSLFRARVSDQPVAARFTDAGAAVRSIDIDAGVATAVLDIPHTAAVRDFLDRLHQWNLNVELRARRSRERPLKTRQTFVAALEGHLTDRQREVLQTAYLSGYFEVPRVSNGQEVTELLGISQPTFSTHLRAAERTLCEILFENGSLAEP